MNISAMKNVIDLNWQIGKFIGMAVAVNGSDWVAVCIKIVEFWI